MPGRSPIRLALLDVGHGNSAVLFAGKESIVIDCPPGDTLPRFLRRHGIAVIHHLVISHADKDHSGGLSVILNSGIDVERIWVLDDQQNTTVHYLAIKHAFAAARTSGSRLLSRGTPHSDAPPALWRDFTLEWVAPNHEDRMVAGNRNRLSVMCLLKQLELGVALFPGDIDLKGFNTVDPNRNLGAIWLIAPHHGGSGGTPHQSVSLIEALLERTGAESVFFSFSRERFQLPRRDVAEVLTRFGVSASMRCSQLSLHCAKELPRERQQSGVLSKGASTFPISCCAGTVILNVGPSGVEWPGRGMHDEFVKSLDTPLCRKGTQDDPEAPGHTLVQLLAPQQRPFGDDK